MSEMSKIYPGQPVWKPETERDKKLFALAVQEGLTWKQIEEKYSDLS